PPPPPFFFQAEDGIRDQYQCLVGAELCISDRALLGFEANITDRTTDGGVLHRVRVGPYTQVEAVNKARAKLLDSGIDVAIVRNQK
ncbi:SPOR domain-containing protein, partial [Massilia sp. AB1]|uniref:SPOR domain-containing protein n=1 Tax=Massilia sp. AB1 TaxID=2823371 RepID=UPI001E584F11